MLDFDSEVFIWVGKDVPSKMLSRVYNKAARAIRAVSCKGKKRIQNITISLTFQGYEPEAFKSAFKSGWEPFQRPGIDDKTINESDSESSKDEEEESKTQFVDSDTETNENQANWKVGLSKKDLELIAESIPDSHWIN